MRGPFIFANPALRIASITAYGSASRTDSQVGNRDRRLLYAQSRLRSLVFCERMVEISSSKGGSGTRQCGFPYLASRRRITNRASRFRDSSEGGVGLFNQESKRSNFECGADFTDGQFFPIVDGPGRIPFQRIHRIVIHDPELAEQLDHCTRPGAIVGIVMT